MGAVVDIRTGHALDAPVSAPATERQRQVAEAKSIIAQKVIDLAQGRSTRTGIVLMLAEIRARYHDDLVREVGGVPSAATLRRWTDAFGKDGLEGLAKGGRGRVRKAYGWEARAQHLFAQPQRPAMSTVAYWLRGEGFATATDSRVVRYLKSLPSNKAETAPKRTGAHYYAQNIRPHIKRDATVLAVGECYEGDGHTCDVYVEHFATGNPFRPELTVWLDVRSQRVTGWWLGEMENSFDVLYALSAAVREHDHVPTLLHTDPGSGYINKMLADEATGFYARLSITPITTLPGNARGKGLTEGWFRWFEERCGKSFPTFCGHCRTDDELSRLRERVRRGEITLPTFLQFRDAVAAFIETYNAGAKPSLQGKSPNELWAALQTNPLALPFESLYRPQKKNVAVRRWEVRLFNRCYRATELAAHEARKVTVEYDIHDDTRVWIRDAKGALVCEALLVEKKPWMSESVLADRRARAAEGQRKRLLLHLDEVNARAKQPVTAAAMVEALDRDVEAQAPFVPKIADRRAPRRTGPPAPIVKPVSQAAHQLVEELEAEAREDRESAEARFGRALALEGADELGEADARWLSIYRTSAEYAARKLIQEEEGASDCSADAFAQRPAGPYREGDL